MDRVLILSTLMMLSAVPAEAGVATYAVRETTEFVLKKFGKEAAEEGVEVLSRKIASLSARYGDDALRAFQKVGPRVSRLVDGAGAHADTALRMLARHGDDAVRIAGGSNLRLVAKYGDNAASALLRHGDAVAPLIDDLGEPAVRALSNLSTRNGRRMAMLAADGSLGRNADEVLGVVGRYGDAACDFIWKHKGALAVGAGLSAFLLQPEPFLTGAEDLTGIVADAAVKTVMSEASKAIPWLLILGGGGFGVLLIGAVWRELLRRRQSAGRGKSHAQSGQFGQQVNLN